MRTFARLLLLLLFAAGSARGGLSAGQLKPKIAEARQHDDAGGARALCGFLNVSLLQAGHFRSKRHALREWEERVNDIQDQIAQLRSPEARHVFLAALQNMPPPSQAVIAMGLSGQPANAETDQAALKLLKRTRDFQVQVACMELLGKHGSGEAVDETVKFLKPASLVSVQIAACRALARIRDARAVGPLIGYLKKFRSGRLRYEANAALRAISGQHFNADGPTWEGWWAKNKEHFKPPIQAVFSFNYELEPEEKKKGEEITYYEIPIIENRVLFVVDTSGSMNYGGKPSRWEKVRTELKNLIARLNEKTLFNIILFSHKVRRWSPKGLAPATAFNKKLAALFLDKARPGGGTETTWALEEALRQVALRYGVETLFLLTDGAPQPMRHSKVTSFAQLPRGNAAIRRRIKFINETLKVRIHTIGVYTRAAGDPKEQGQKSMKAFLEGVAQDNDGVYKEVP